MEKYYKREESYHLIPILFLIIAVPLIVHMKVIQLSGIRFDFWTGEKQNYDFFSYYKMVWIIICASLTFLMFLIKWYEDGFKKIRKSVYYIPVFIYTVCVILSSLLSQYKDVAFKGFVDRYEGMYVIIAYMLILSFVIYYVNSEKHLKIILVSLFIGAVIIGLIGLFQYLGHDIWKTSFGKGLILPQSYKNLASQMDFKFGKNTIYSSLYHYDYVGSYMAMLFPLTFAMFVLLKNKIYKIIMLIITALMAFNWIGCNSRAGVVGGIMAILVFIIMMHKYIAKNWKYFLGGVAVLIVLFFGLNKFSNGYLGSRFSALIKDITNISQNDKNNNAKNSITLKDIKIEGKSAVIVTSTETLKIGIMNGQLVFQDAADNYLKFGYDAVKGNIIIIDSKYKDYDIIYGKMGKDNGLKVVKGQIKLLFDVSDNGFKLLDNKGNIVDLNKPIEKWGFEGKERLGSSRGYIWSRSIPLLKHTIIFGYGPDTFTIHFPQNDLLGKMYAYYGDMWQLVDKPHDFYLQVGINTGMISLIALLALFIMYIVKSVKIYFRNDYTSFTAIAGVGVFVAVIGYLGAATFNDSVVSVAPVFWVLLGLGIAINQMLMPEKVGTVCKDSAK